LPAFGRFELGAILPSRLPFPLQLEVQVGARAALSVMSGRFRSKLCAGMRDPPLPVIRLMEAVLFGRYPSPGAMCRLTTPAGQVTGGSAFIRPAIKAGSACYRSCHHGAGVPPGEA